MDDGEGIWNLMESDEHELAVPVQSSGAVEEEGGTFKTGAMRFLLDISISEVQRSPPRNVERPLRPRIGPREWAGFVPSPIQWRGF